MEHIDAILYINLDRRTDRKQHIEAEFKRMNIPMEKVHRIKAISHPFGHIGCAQSHIKCLEIFRCMTTWNTVMIMEDDFTFRGTSFDDFNKPLQDFWDKPLKWDVLLTTYNPSYWVELQDTEYPGIKKVQNSVIANGYILKRDYIDTLLNTFQFAEEGMRKHSVSNQFCIDVAWHELQRINNWYCVQPALGYQYPNYSDIGKFFVDYDC